MLICLESITIADPTIQQFSKNGTALVKQWDSFKYAGASVHSIFSLLGPNATARAQLAAKHPSWFWGTRKMFMLSQFDRLIFLSQKRITVQG